MKKSQIITAVRKEIKESGKRYYEKFTMQIIESALERLHPGEWESETVTTINKMIPRDILSQVSYIMRIPVKVIVSKKKTNEVCAARFLFAYYIRANYKSIFSLKFLGSFVGNRDHASIIHAFLEGRKLLEEGDEYFTECYIKLCELRQGLDVVPEGLKKYEAKTRAVPHKSDTHSPAQIPQKNIIKMPVRNKEPFVRHKGVYNNSPSPYKIHQP